MKYLFPKYNKNLILTLLLITNIKTTSVKNSIKSLSEKKDVENIKEFKSQNNKINLLKKEEEEDECTIKNCLKCSEKGECIVCNENYILEKKRCYSTQCSIFGFCKFCDEYDCLSCLKGYQLQYGTCDTLDKEAKKKRIIYISIISGLITIIIIAIIIFCIFRKKKNKNNNYISDKIITKKHPKTGNYLIVHPIKDDSIHNNSIVNNNNNVSSIDKTSYSSSLNIDKTQEKKCILCHKKNIFSFSDCGCSLCYDHYIFIKDNNEIICPLHKIPLKKSFFIQLEKKSSLKGNAIEQLGQTICPLCKIYPAVQSFNCGCNMKLCTKCFNDNVFVFKYNQCPGCGKPYNPKEK